MYRHRRPSTESRGGTAWAISLLTRANWSRREIMTFSLTDWSSRPMK